MKNITGIISNQSNCMSPIFSIYWSVICSALICMAGMDFRFRRRFRLMCGQHIGDW